MAGNNKTVILCKGSSDKNDKQEAYVKMLKSAGYICKCLRTLRFEFVNTLELQTCLLAADKYSGNLQYYILPLVIFIFHKFML